jgi:hypothetical protein
MCIQLHIGILPALAHKEKQVRLATACFIYFLAKRNGANPTIVTYNVIAVKSYKGIKWPSSFSYTHSFFE